MTSYLLADRHCIVVEKSPAYLDRLLLAAGIISGCSGFFNILTVLPFVIWYNLQSFFFRGSKPGKIRTIRQHGTPVPDPEKGSIASESANFQVEESNNVFMNLKNAFRKAGRDSSPPINISRPMQYE